MKQVQNSQQQIQVQSQSQIQNQAAIGASQQKTTEAMETRAEEAKESSKEAQEPKGANTFDDNYSDSINTSERGSNHSYGQETDTQGHGDLITKLPHKLTPPVLYAIDSTYKVCGKRTYTGSNTQESLIFLRQAVVQAISDHLKREKVVLEKAGDWINIPCMIPSKNEHEEVYEFVKKLNKMAKTKKVDNKEKYKIIPKRLQYMAYLIKINADYNLQTAYHVCRKRYSASYFFDFAIRLANDDIIVPDTLVTLARQSKRATLGAALRMLSKRPATLVGEAWSSQDWYEVNKNNNKKINKDNKAVNNSEGKNRISVKG